MLSHWPDFIMRVLRIPPPGEFCLIPPEWEGRLSLEFAEPSEAEQAECPLLEEDE